MVDQRKAKRFDMRLPVRLLRTGLRVVSATGETVNLSSGGVLFLSDAHVEIGDSVEYTIGLRPPEGATDVTLHCLGKVIRARPTAVNNSGHPFEIAATLERYEFIRKH